MSDEENVSKRLGKYRVRRSGAALTITIPSEYVAEYGVKQGDAYVVTDVLGSLLVQKALV